MLLLKSVTPMYIGDVVAACKVETVGLEDPYVIADNIPDDTSNFDTITTKVLTTSFTQPKINLLSGIITLTLQRKQPKGFSEPLVDPSTLSYNLVKVLNEIKQEYETHLIVNLYVQGQTAIINEFPYGEENIDGSITIYDTVVNWELEDKRFDVSDYPDFKRVLFDIYKLLKGMILKQNDVKGYIKRFKHLLDNNVAWKDDVENVKSIEDNLNKTGMFKSLFGTQKSNLEKELTNLKDTFKKITDITTAGNKRLSTITTYVNDINTFLTTLKKELAKATIDDVTIDRTKFDKAYKNIETILGNIWRLIAYIEEGYEVVNDKLAEAQETILTSQNEASVLSSYISQIRKELDPYRATHILLQDHLLNELSGTASLSSTNNQNLENKITDSDVKKVYNSVTSNNLNKAIEDLRTELLNLKKTSLTSLTSIATVVNNVDQWVSELDNKKVILESLRKEIEDNIEVYETLMKLVSESFAIINRLVFDFVNIEDKFHSSLNAIVLKLRAYYKNKEHFMLTLQRMFFIKSILDDLVVEYKLTDMTEYKDVVKTITNIENTILPSVEKIVKDTENNIADIRKTKDVVSKDVTTITTELADISDTYNSNVEALESLLSTSREVLETITDTIRDVLGTRLNVTTKQLDFNLKKQLQQEVTEVTMKELSDTVDTISKQNLSVKERLKHLDNNLRSIGQNLTRFTLSS